MPLQDRLCRLDLLISGDRADAEDVVAEAMAATFVPGTSGRVESLLADARTAVVTKLAGGGRRAAGMLRPCTTSGG
ncbi:MAG: hypothetical protein Q8K58_04135 [Acidimicrobiales bacterium]|nr:hypothetical protein [Acidimicrobiales bacterium]